MSNWFTRLFGQMANELPDESVARQHPNVERIFESIIPIAGMYGLDFGHFDSKGFMQTESH
ncbi:hypothetical protein [Erwinia sp.]|uniref:hypothetical protein n=1 Tax=Erwinia citreus TaxID=558 RepID=UPI003C738AA5